MAAPATDPPDHVRVATRSIAVLGALSAAFGLVFLVLFGYLNRYERFRPWFLGMGIAVWFGPGVAFLACAHLMRASNRAGATGALVTAAFQLLCATALLVATATFDPVSPLPIVLGVLWVVGLLDCIRRLRWARRLLGARAEGTRGFDLAAAAATAPRPVIPVTGPGTSDPESART